MSQLMHAAHMAHVILLEKEKRQKKLEHDNKKLSKLRVRLREKFTDFMGGKQVKIRELSHEFLEQAIVVDEEKKKLDALHERIKVVRMAPFDPKFYERTNS